MTADPLKGAAWCITATGKILDVPWAVYASRSYIERHGAPRSAEEIEQHFVVLCDDCGSECRAASWLRSVAPHAKIAVRCDTGYEQVGLVKSGAGLAPMLTYKGDADLVRVIGFRWDRD
jgi:DNA-binding transcriptional LysR family regulator